MTKAIRKAANVGARAKLAEYAEKHRELEELLLQYKQADAYQRGRITERNRALVKLNQDLNDSYQEAGNLRRRVQELEAVTSGQEIRISGLLQAEATLKANNREAWQQYKDMRRLARALFTALVAALGYALVMVLI